MEIKARNRNGGQGYTVNHSETKVKYNLDLSVLDTMVSYVMSANKHIKKGNLIQLRNFIEILDETVFENDIEKRTRLEFIKRGLIARLDKGLNKPALILSYISNGVDGIYDLSLIPELDNVEMQFVNDTVSNGLSSAFCDRNFDKFNELYVRYKAAPIKDRINQLGEIEAFVKQMYNDFRQSKSKEMIMTSFSLDKETFDSDVSDIYDTVTAPGRFLFTGCQGINQIIGGGFEATRFYLFVGTAGVGKSMFLLNLARQIKKYNNGLLAKDPTKIPTIVYLTQENSIEETVERLFAMISSGGKMKDYSKSDVINMLQNDGELMLDAGNNINLHVIWKADSSIDTGELYTIVEELEDDGYECICLLQDHIRRIRPVLKSSELRIQLGTVVNEMKTFAQMKQIPVISVTHLNRDASSRLDAGCAGNKVDLTKLLGRANVSESVQMIDNADFVHIINKEYDRNDNPYLVLMELKSRCRVDNHFICTPFEANNETNLIQDYDTEPVYKTTLEDNSMVANMAQVMNNNNKLKCNNTSVNTMIANSNVIAGSYLYDDEDDCDLNSILSGKDYSINFTNNSKPIITPPNGTIGNRNLSNVKVTIKPLFTIQ